jgi:4-amino-4-deoxy-L-arabinose transferase-like glycosyltransferase
MRTATGTRRTTILVAVAAVALAVLLRLPFFGAPLTADEGGYAEAARLWERGATLYRDIWVDRPQGLLLVFRGVLELGSSTDVIRGVAAAVGALSVLATMLLAFRLTGRRTVAYASGLLMATAGASPFLESFTLAGELLASFAAILSLLAFTAYLRSRSLAWLAVAGLASGCAVMIKQSGFDAAVAIVAYVVWTERRRALRPLAVFVGAAAAPVLAGLLGAVSLHSWWFAVVGYRGSGDSLVTGSVVHRLGLLVDSLPGAAKGLGLLVLLAALGWGGSPLLLRLWLGAAVLGVLGGGNFHYHYYLQLVPPLAILAGSGVEKLIAGRMRLTAAVLAAVAIATAAFTVPLWFDGPRAQANAIWPKDPHLQHDVAVARYLDAHTRPGQKALVLWAAANVYYLADRAPAIPYMWRRNIETIPGVRGRLERELARRAPAVVALVQPLDSLEGSGRTATILARNYRRAAALDGVPVYVPRRPS